MIYTLVIISAEVYSESRQPSIEGKEDVEKYIKLNLPSKDIINLVDHDYGKFLKKF